ncbi:histidine kinase [Paenibacillus sp. YPG26]|uniref:histidine kinase n=1 Tax=Paenibacillus sp. YPG26 TaxID=2878915 RepID=UPI00203CD469|nr:histidine kinase [Paenibacillus sp. YPG26]USB33370.1 histidine kinase [Paenibacillus sp. YPG26]
MKIKDQQNLLFQNLSNIKNYWVSESTSSLLPEADLIWCNNPEQVQSLSEVLNNDELLNAFKDYQKEIIQGVIHSILVMFDGGDALAEKLRIELINAETKEILNENIALHEDFIEFLIDNE